MFHFTCVHTVWVSSCVYIGLLMSKKCCFESRSFIERFELGPIIEFDNLIELRCRLRKNVWIWAFVNLFMNRITSHVIEILTNVFEDWPGNIFLICKYAHEQYFRVICFCWIEFYKLDIEFKLKVEHIELFTSHRARVLARITHYRVLHKSSSSYNRPSRFSIRIELKLEKS